jgi:hypothetical protein
VLVHGPLLCCAEADAGCCADAGCVVHSERPAGGWGGDGCSAGAPTTTAAAAAAAAGLSAAGETATGEIAGELQWGY